MKKEYSLLIQSINPIRESYLNEYSFYGQGKSDFLTVFDIED